MIYFKNETGDVFAYETQEERDLFGAAELVPMTADEVAAHISPQPTAEQLQERINAEARAYLADTDWYVIRTQETGEPVPAEVLAERAAARARVVE